jgi:hypothetical protein
MRRVPPKATKTVRSGLASVGRPLLAAVVVALLVTAAAVVTGLVEYVPRVAVPGTGWTMSPRIVLWTTTFVLAAIGCAGYLLYRAYEDAIADQWGRLSIRVRATVVGGCCGALVAIGLGIAAVAGPVPPSVTLVGSLLAWPVATVLMLRQHRDPGTADGSPSALRSLLVRVGYAQAKPLRTRTLAGIVGVAGAVLGTLGIRALVSWLPWLDGPFTHLRTVLLAACLWVVVTVLVHGRYESTMGDRTALRIVAVSSPGSRSRELTIENDGPDPVELTRAKIRDTERDRYRLDGGSTLEPGQRRTFAIPDGFLLEPNEAATELPLGYSLKRGGERPIIYTRTGERFVLEGDDAPDRDPTSSPGSQTIEPGSDPTPQG